MNLFLISNSIFFLLSISVTGPLTELQIAYVCQQTLTGLAYMHTLGKMHRDIKVSMVVITLYSCKSSMNTQWWHLLSSRDVKKGIKQDLF